MKIVNGAFGAIFNAQGQILLTQRYEPETPEAHLKWQLPGGRQEFGESLEKTLLRELCEELGINECTILNHQPLTYFNIWEINKKDKTHVNLFVYVATIGSQVPFINDGETNDLGWYSLHQASKLDFLPHGKEMIVDANEIYTKHLASNTK